MNYRLTIKQTRISSSGYPLTDEVVFESDTLFCLLDFISHAELVDTKKSSYKIERVEKEVKEDEAL